MAAMKSWLIALLVVFSGSACADWKRLGASEGETHFYDSSTITKKEGKAMMWTLMDLKSPIQLNGVLVRSIKAQVEYDCIELKSRHVFQIYHAELGGTGKVVSTEDAPQNWMPLPPASIGRFMLVSACIVGKQ